MKTLFLVFTISFTASATPELGTSTITSTPSESIHLLAICEPTSALFWWSAKITSTVRPLALAPKSSIAIFAAVTEPCPPRSAYRLDWSFRMPIFTTLPEIWAWAPADRASAAAAAIALSFIFICLFLLMSLYSLHTKVLVKHLCLRLEFRGGEGLRDFSVFHHVMP